MNEFGLSVVVAGIIAFAAICIKDAIDNHRKRKGFREALDFARFETRGPGTTDVYDCAGKVCPCETACANGVEKLR